MPHREERKHIEPWLADVADFYTKVLKLPIPDKPVMMQPTTQASRVELLMEEVKELEDATTIEDQADALIDVLYLALGGLIAMGIVPGAAFEIVHEANMRKVAGANEKRPAAGKAGDAVKPRGWTPPDLSPALALSLTEVMAGTFPLFAVCADIRRQRGKQYNQGDIDIQDYFPYGDVSNAQMLHVKATRIQAEMQGCLFRGEEMEFEVLQEHLRDLVNYLCFWYEGRCARES